MRISDWSSDVCSSDLGAVLRQMAQPDYPHSFDPRTRPWYLKALETAGVARTDPYVFNTPGALGLTFAQRSSRAGAVVGADISLASDRKRVVAGKRVSVRVDRGVRGTL